MEITERQREVLLVVQEQVGYLMDEWEEDVTDRSIRFASPILRSLVVDKKLGEAWRIAGFPKEPRIMAVDLDAGRFPGASLAFASAGGGNVNGTSVREIRVHSRALSDEEIRESAMGRPVLTDMMLTHFSESTAMVISGRKIRRREVIQYVANRMGGAHIDPISSEDAPWLLEIDNAMKNIQIAHRRAPLFELVSIGQAIYKSPDVHRLANLRI